MPGERLAERISGKTLRFTWNDGPTQGETHEHVFHEDGSVEYHQVGDTPQKGKPTREKKYAAVKVTDDVYVVSYLASSGFTLTTVLNFDDNTIVAFASNDKQWFPIRGTFEEV